MNRDAVRVLLVDDEADYRQNIARLLSTRGFETLEAADGKACLSTLESQPVDVVVLDMKMPGMNGLDALARIREHYPDIEVIMLTGQATVTDGVEGIKTGAFDYLSKPVEIEHLAAKIRQAVEKIRREEACRREEAFREQMDRQMIAAERLAALGTLAAGVAHEINNPLSVIKQSITWLTLRMKNNEDARPLKQEEIRKTIHHIDAAVDRARRITHQLLESARKAENDRVEIDLDLLTEDAVFLVASSAAEKGVILERKADPRLKTVRGNPDGLRQVLTNLLVNAIQAAPSGGTVTLATEDHGEEYALTVTDPGIGIPDENLHRIFEPFFTTKPAGQGTGLGLYVTRSILDSLGGSITVKSRVGRGSRFSVRLPKLPRNGAPRSSTP